MGEADKGFKDFEGRKVQYVKVTDKAGNEWMCEAEALTDPESATIAQKENCVDDATMAGVKKK